MIINLENYEKALITAITILKNKGIIIYPTDTVYGIGCRADDYKTVLKLIEIKKRDPSKPMSILLSDLEMLREYVYLDKNDEKIILSHLPGPYTFILKAKKNFAWNKTNTLGVRVPEHFFMRKVVARLGVPIITTSANISGEKPPIEFTKIKPELIEKVELVINGGATLYKKPSKIIDLVNKKIIRE